MMKTVRRIVAGWLIGVVVWAACVAWASAATVERVTSAAVTDGRPSGAPLPEAEKPSAPERVWGHLKAPWVASEPVFKAKELTLDLGASYRIAEPRGIGKVLETDAHHGTWGIAFGTTYWLSRYLGGGVEAGILDYHRPGNLVIDYTTLTLNGRVPIGRFAPYAVVGVGREFKEGLWNTQAGAGVEWRVTGRVGIFADSRFIWQTKKADECLLNRAGLRFVF